MEEKLEEIIQELQGNGSTFDSGALKQIKEAVEKELENRENSNEQ